jgi:hypothetical protein
MEKNLRLMGKRGRKIFVPHEVSLNLYIMIKINNYLVKTSLVVQMCLF